MYERAELPVKTGSEADFELAMAECVPLLTAEGGAHSATWGRGIEDPSTYLLLLEWDSPEHHAEYAKTEAAAEFADRIFVFFARRPAIAHFEMLG